MVLIFGNRLQFIEKIEECKAELAPTETVLSALEAAEIISGKLLINHKKHKPGTDNSQAPVTQYAMRVTALESSSLPPAVEYVIVGVQQIVAIPNSNCELPGATSNPQIAPTSFLAELQTDVKPKGQQPLKPI